MKRTLLVMLFLCGSFAAWSQSVSVGSVDIIPEYPTVSDSVKVRVIIVVTSYSTKIYDSLSIAGDTIHIYYCVTLTPLTSVTAFTDTFALGTLAAGDYTVLVKAYVLMDTTCNNPVDSVSDTKPFTVTETVSVKNETLENGFSLHLAPNPTASTQQLVVKTQKPGNVNIQLYDISGRLVRDVFSGQVQPGEQSFTADLTNLKNGVYVFKVFTDENVYTLKTIKQ